MLFTSVLLWTWPLWLMVFKLGTWTTTWMDFTLLQLLWTNLLFTLPRTSWPCPTSRHATTNILILCINWTVRLLQNWETHSFFFLQYFTRFLSFLVSGEARDKENLSNVSLSLPRWESSEFLAELAPPLCAFFKNSVRSSKTTLKYQQT